MINTFEDALYRAITNGRSPATEGKSVASMVAEITRAFGVHMPDGISDRTWRRLRADPTRNVQPKTYDVLRLAQRRARLSPGREARLRAAGGYLVGMKQKKGKPGAAGVIHIMARIKISNDERDPRLLKVEDLKSTADPRLPPIEGMLGPVLDAWLRGDDQAAVDAFVAPISAAMGATVHFSDVEWIKLG